MLDPNFLIIGVACGLMVVEIYLILCIKKLTSQLRDMNKKLEATTQIVADKLHLIVDKINFDIPKIITAVAPIIASFRSKSEDPK